MDFLIKWTSFTVVPVEDSLVLELGTTEALFYYLINRVRLRSIG